MKQRLYEKIKYYEDLLGEVNWLYNFYLKKEHENSAFNNVKKQKDKIEATLMVLNYIAEGE